MEIKEAEEVKNWLETQWQGHFDWDDGNLHKLAKHSVTKDEAEFVFLNESLFQGQILAPPEAGWGQEKRFLQFGETSNDHYFTIVWTRRESKVRVISCRRMRDGEKKDYREKKSGRNRK